MINLRLCIYLLFLPAGTTLATQALIPSLLGDQAVSSYGYQTVAGRLLALTLLLLCIELAHMAWVDLRNIQMVEQSSDDSRLPLFYGVVVSTIVLELLGFYGAMFSLQWGGVVVIASQLWFNLLAKVQLWPFRETSIEPFGVSKRLSVLFANGSGLVLLLFWSAADSQLWISLLLLLLVVGFLFIKYIFSDVPAPRAEASKIPSSKIQSLESTDKQEK